MCPVEGVSVQLLRCQPRQHMSNTNSLQRYRGETFPTWSGIDLLFEPLSVGYVAPQARPQAFCTLGIEQEPELERPKAAS